MNKGKAEHTSGAVMVPVDGAFEPVTDDHSPEARAELDCLALEKTGQIRIILDCGINGSQGSWPFAITLSEISNTIIDGYGEDHPGVAAEILARALELEAARVRGIVPLR